MPGDVISGSFRRTCVLVLLSQHYSESWLSDHVTHKNFFGLGRMFKKMRIGSFFLEVVVTHVHAVCEEGMTAGLL
jgi:hypothetical protein